MGTGDLVVSFFKMLFALLLVLSILVGLLYFFRRFLSQSPFTDQGNSLINIVATRYLGPKNSLALVEVLGRAVLLGVSPERISLLVVISEREALEKISQVQKMVRRERRLSPAANPFLMGHIVRATWDLLKGMKKK